VTLIPYQTDERFWVPNGIAAKNQICSVGLEYRDYDTLVNACAGTGVNLVIAAASHWSTHSTTNRTNRLPPNVTITSLDYSSLRQLYAESQFVVVPLKDVDNQAGITTILEAMAMGKAVIVSHARGQTDVVRDRRRISRADQRRKTQPDWARTLGASDGTHQGQTGIYVQPGDPDELRRAIIYLLEHPEQAHVMGSNGRRLIEEAMGLDQFTSRVAALVTER
jgi:glycosyltransferase involved in cell wall biosynthesis